MKKETSKVPPAPTATAPAAPAPAPAAVRPGAPQATVKLETSSPAASPKVTINPQPTGGQAVVDSSEDNVTSILAIAATVIAFVSLGIQVWMFL